MEDQVLTHGNLVAVVVQGVKVERLDDIAVQARAIRGKASARRIATTEQSILKIIGYNSHHWGINGPRPMDIGHVRKAKCFACGDN